MLECVFEKHFEIRGWKAQRYVKHYPRDPVTRSSLSEHIQCLNCINWWLFNTWTMVMGQQLIYLLIKDYLSHCIKSSRNIWTPSFWSWLHLGISSLTIKEIIYFRLYLDLNFCYQHKVFLKKNNTYLIGDQSQSFYEFKQTGRITYYYVLSFRIPAIWMFTNLSKT